MDDNSAICNKTFILTHSFLEKKVCFCSSTRLVKEQTSKWVSVVSKALSVLKYNICVIPWIQSLEYQTTFNQLTQFGKVILSLPGGWESWSPCGVGFVNPETANKRVSYLGRQETWCKKVAAIAPVMVRTDAAQQENEERQQALRLRASSPKLLLLWGHTFVAPAWRPAPSPSPPASKLWNAQHQLCLR